MNVLNKQILLWGNVSEETFHQIEKPRNHLNWKRWRTISLVAFIYFTLCFLSTHIVSVVFGNLLVYLVLAAIMLIAFVLFSTVVKENSKALLPFIYFLSFSLLAFGLTIGVVFAGENLSVTYHVLLVLLPLLVVDRPYRMGILELLMSAAYVVMSLIFKDGAVMRLDIFNVFIFAGLGQFVNYYMVCSYMKQMVAVRQIEIMRNTDDLTNMNNRNAYEDEVRRLDKEVLENDFVYVMLDVNGLKEANDHIGHDAGDELLEAAADCIRNCFDPYGKTYRIGGDEYVAMIHTQGKDMTEICEPFYSAMSAWKGKLVKHSVLYVRNYLHAVQHLPYAQAVEEGRQAGRSVPLI